MLRFFLLALLLLPACRSRSEPITAESVIDAFKVAGIELTVTEINPFIEASSPLPRSFHDHIVFTDAILVAQGVDHGGQIFVCDEPKHCQALQAYFDAFIALAGPYTYTSSSGLVVAQLNSGFTPEQAARYEAVLENF